VFSVDADGTSNPLTILDGSTLPNTVINSPGQTYYHLIQSISPSDLASLDRRIQIKVYANFLTASNVVLYFRQNNIITVLTSIPQVALPIIADTVDLRITCSATTTEFDQVFATSIPISIAEGDAKIYSASVNCIANLQAGDSFTCTVASVEGLVEVESGQSTLPDPANTLQWNLIAQGAYGNVGVIV
jgi:hypothetical protein